MALAARVPDQDPGGKFRHMIHDEADKWVDLIIDEVFADGKSPTVEQLSELFSKTKRKFFGACFQALIEQKYAVMLGQQYAACPKCGKMCKKRRDGAKEMETMQGPSALKRPWFYCVGCSHGFTPLDKVLEISRKKYQFDVQKKSTRTAAQVPFSGGSELFAELTGHAVGGHFMHETFEEVGAFARLEDVIPSREEITQRVRSAKKGSWRPVLVVASDGAHVPTRPEPRPSTMRKGARASGGKPRGSASTCLARIESCMWPVGIKSRMKSNLARIWRWWRRASARMIFASGCWATEPTGCGNTWPPAFPRGGKYWTTIIVRSISTRWPSFNTATNPPNAWNGWKARWPGFFMPRWTT